MKVIPNLFKWRTYNSLCIERSRETEMALSLNAYQQTPKRRYLRADIKIKQLNIGNN